MFYLVYSLNNFIHFRKIRKSKKKEIDNLFIRHFLSTLTKLLLYRISNKRNNDKPLTCVNSVF